MRAKIPLLLLLTVAAGCSQPLPSRAVVDDLRILGVRAEPPEAAPGASVHFDALIADPRGGGRALKLAWALCTPGDAGVATCGDPSRVAMLGTGGTADWVVPDSALAGLSFDDALEGRDVYVVLGVEPADIAPDDHNPPHDAAFKRVRVSTNPSPNHNPSIDSLLVAGSPASPSPITGQPGAKLDLDVTASPDSAESWTSAAGSGVEDVRYTWSISAGSVSDAVSYGAAGEPTANLWRLPDGSNGPPEAMLWVVLRDGRGGTDWKQQPVTLP
jgi:hypothetical protein